MILDESGRRKADYFFDSSMILDESWRPKADYFGGLWERDAQSISLAYVLWLLEFLHR
jgi:hypothetical protein